MSTGAIIFVSCFLKAALFGWLQHKGWMLTPEERAKRRVEEKKLLLAYREWRKDAGPEAAAELSTTLERFTQRARSRRAIKNSAG